MNDSEVVCCSHGKARAAFVCQHLLNGEKVGWHEPDEYSFEYDDEFAGCINAWCDECDEMAFKTGGWNDESEAFADISLICENCALGFKETNLK